MNRMRLLLIEDEASAVEITKRLLGPFASRIDSAARLETAMGMIERNQYDVVILDLTLVGSDRESTIAAIPTIKEKAKAPVVVATGWPDPAIKARCMAAGADAFVSKNEITKTVLMAVQMALQNAPDKSREPSFAEHVALLNRMLKTA